MNRTNSARSGLQRSQSLGRDDHTVDNDGLPMTVPFDQAKNAVNYAKQRTLNRKTSGEPLEMVDDKGRPVRNSM